MVFVCMCKNLIIFFKVLFAGRSSYDKYQSCFVSVVVNIKLISSIFPAIIEQYRIAHRRN